MLLPIFLSALCTVRRHLLSTKGSWEAAPATTAAKFAQAAQKWVSKKLQIIFEPSACACSSARQSPGPQLGSWSWSLVKLFQKFVFQLVYKKVPSKP